MLQHFSFLERPVSSREGDGESFQHLSPGRRAAAHAYLAPMPIEYDTIGAFYATLGGNLRAFAEPGAVDDYDLHDGAFH